jgi:hypothetical protein
LGRKCCDWLNCYHQKHIPLVSEFSRARGLCAPTCVGELVTNILIVEDERRVRVLTLSLIEAVGPLRNLFGINSPEVRSGGPAWRVRFVFLDFPLHYRRSLEDHGAARKNWRFDACFRIPPDALALLPHRERPKRRQFHRFASRNGVYDLFQREINQGRRFRAR